ncbi:MAG: hypothetical protein LBC41_12350 [Clostridiales bacterium]|jgi:hypothetical protein|nr:hypothetical protein [Clostridiales bacterium]
MKNSFALGFYKPMSSETERELSMIVIEELLTGKTIRSKAELLEFMEPTNKNFGACLDAINKGLTVRAGSNTYKPELAMKLSKLLLDAIRDSGDVKVLYSDM